MKQGGILLIFLIFTFASRAQSLVISPEGIGKTEMELRHYSDSIMRGSTDEVRMVALAAFNPVFLDLLNDPETFNYPFDSLPAISKVTSKDGLLRIYTWLHPSISDGTFKCFGILQRINPESRQMKTIGLMDFRLDTEEAEANELKTDTWYGAVYYEIIEKKINKKTYYFLLGWKGVDRLTTKKVIDVAFFDAWDNVAFGAPVFTDETKKKKHRLIFEFNAQAVMLLRFDKKKKMIVFDHLSPASPSGRGQYRYYGPDFTYDGLQFKKGKWNYKSNLDLRNSGDSK